MKKKMFVPGMVVVFIWLISLTLGAGFAQAASTDEAAALAAQESGTCATLISYTKEQLVDNIYEYVWVFQVGPGQFDKVGVHRVIKEIRTVPVKAPRGVMMVHGDASTFTANFLASKLSPQVPVDQSIVIFLARNNIDIWGVDRRWTFVPDTTTDFTFMKNWNTALHLGDIRFAVKFARLMRGITRSGCGKIFMLGHSRGAQFTYAYANEETQLPAACRDLKGIIPMDMVYKFSPLNDDLRRAAFARYLIVKDMRDNQGIYYSDEAAGLKYIAFLAATDPDGQSPIPGFEGLTNKQAALIVLAVTYYTFVPPAEPYVPFYHYLAGIFDSSGMPTGLRYTNFGFALDIAAVTPGFMSNGEDLDGEALMSNAVDVPYDDYLSQIKIPVFYIGAAGGFGEYGKYTVTLLGSADKKTLVVKRFPSGSEALDYGHADVVWGGSAKTLVWTPIYNWLMAH